VDLHTQSEYYSFYPDYSIIENEHNTSNTSFSGMAFTELCFHFDKTMALGVIADYVYLPDEQIPEITEAGLMAQSIRMRHGSVGILLSLHF
jgi:hypothetical protein